MANKALIFPDGVSVDTISELTAANGVVIDGVTLKDGGITGTGDIRTSDTSDATEASTAAAINCAGGVRASANICSSSGTGAIWSYGGAAGVSSVGASNSSGNYAQQLADNASFSFYIKNQAGGVGAAIVIVVDATGGTAAAFFCYYNATPIQITANSNFSTDGTTDNKIHCYYSGTTHKFTIKNTNSSAKYIYAVVLGCCATQS